MKLLRKMPLEKKVDLSKLLCTSAGVVMAAMAAGSALADDSGWYVGANAGQARAKIDDARITGNLLAAGFTTTAFKNDDTHFGFKLYGGYQFVKYFALEGGYFDLGRFGFTANTSPPAGLTGDTKLKGANLDAVGIIPFTDRFAAFGRIGYTYTDAKDRFAGYGAVIVKDPSLSQHSSNYKFGFGLQYALSDSWGMRAEAERYRLGDAVGNKGDVDLFSVGLLYRFGATQQTPPPPPPVAKALPLPEPASPPPPPPPAPPPACVAPAGFKVDADCRIIEQTMIVRAVDFEFNSAQLTFPARQTLDEVAASIVKQPELKVEIQGYADSTGSAEYNLHLSQKRAESVRSYLMSKGVNDSAVTAKGFGKANPIATNDTTEGRAQNRRVAFQVTTAPPHVKVVSAEATPASTEAAKQGEPERAKKEHQDH